MVTLTYQERFKTAKGVFDAFTKRNLFELSQRGFFDEIISPLKVGKESNVFLASSGKGFLIIKIYRVQNADFKGMYKYISLDPRYEKLKKRRREIIFSWVRREYQNLFVAKKNGVRVPKVYTVKHNVLVLDIVGKKKSGEVALPLKDTVPVDPEKFLDGILFQVRKLWKKAGLVHGDLSSFNILNDNEKPVLIDFSQSTLVKSSNADELLRRDLKNVLGWFRKLGVVRDLDEVYAKIVK